MLLNSLSNAKPSQGLLKTLYTLKMPFQRLALTKTVEGLLKAFKGLQRRSPLTSKRLSKGLCLEKNVVKGFKKISKRPFEGFWNALERLLKGPQKAYRRPKRPFEGLLMP